MNKEAIIVGRNYECRKNDFARPIIGEVIELEDDKCVVDVQRFYGLDVDKIDATNGKIEVKYSEIHGVSNGVFFN